MNPHDNMVLESLDHSYLFFKSKLIGASTEEVWVAALDSNCRVISSAMLFKGTINYCLFHPRDILRFAIIHNAVFFILAHNHPSNECLPSSSDIDNTKNLYFLSKFMQIPLLDHLIVTDDDCFSFKDKNFLNEWDNDLFNKELFAWK
jgi:DNA repair protein RadC